MGVIVLLIFLSMCFAAVLCIIGFVDRLDDMYEQSNTCYYAAFGVVFVAFILSLILGAVLMVKNLINS